MSYLIASFEVSARAVPGPVQVRFMHLLSGIATRHSDTMDAVFRLNGQRVCVSISCPALSELRERQGKYLTDQQLAEIAALFLRRTLEQGYDPTQAELYIGGTALRDLGRQLGCL
ncbi:MAG TPA: hypothetical protein VGW33_10710 [Terriglobia bacterium]|nr:hypothetical protein [Terriglobia bacterium]